jgi:hypothetical protein
LILEHASLPNTLPLSVSLLLRRILLPKEADIRTSFSRLLERIGRFGDEPITESNWRPKALVAGIVVVVPLVLVVVNETRVLAEQDLPPSLLSPLEVTEFKRTAKIQTEKTPAGITVVRGIADSGLNVWISNGTNWTINSFTIRITGKTADGDSFTRDFHHDRIIASEKDSPIRTYKAMVSVSLGGSPNDFQVGKCEIIGARGIAPRGFFGFLSPAEAAASYRTAECTSDARNGLSRC